MKGRVYRFVVSCRVETRQKKGLKRTKWMNDCSDKRQDKKLVVRMISTSEYQP